MLSNKIEVNQLKLSRCSIVDYGENVG